MLAVWAGEVGLLSTAEVRALRAESRSHPRAAATALGVSAVQWGPTLAWALGTGEPGRAFWNLEMPAYVPDRLGEVYLHLLAGHPATLPFPL